MYTKKTSLFFINVAIITLLSCIANMASAQSATSTASSSPTQTNTSTPLATTTEPIIVSEETAVSVTKSILTIQKRIRVTNLIANISNRIEAGASRLQNISNRIESRLVKLEIEGYDMAITKQHLGEARDALGKIHLEMETIDEEVNAMVSSDRPVELWKNIKTSLIICATELQNAKTSLLETITSMKAAEVSAPHSTASTTPTTIDGEELIN